MKELYYRIRMWFVMRNIRKELKKAVSDGNISQETADMILSLVKVIAKNDDNAAVISAALTLEMLGVAPRGATIATFGGGSDD